MHRESSVHGLWEYEQLPDVETERRRDNHLLAGLVVAVTFSLGVWASLGFVVWTYLLG